MKLLRVILRENLLPGEASPAEPLLGSWSWVFFIVHLPQPGSKPPAAGPCAHGDHASGCSPLGFVFASNFDLARGRLPYTMC